MIISEVKRDDTRSLSEGTEGVFSPWKQAGVGRVGAMRRGSLSRAGGEGLRPAGDTRRGWAEGSARPAPRSPRSRCPKRPGPARLPDAQRWAAQTRDLGNRRVRIYLPAVVKKILKKLERSHNNELPQQTHSSLPPFPSFYLTIKSSPSICHDRRDQEPGDYPN